MPKQRAPRNRTLSLTPEETDRYAALCAAPGAAEGVVLGDAFDALALLPRGFVDLLIVDPPYNLSKRYASSPFARMGEEAYRAFTERWAAAVLPALKPEASVYVCCDWRGGAVIGDVLRRHFHLRNRITWQREKGRGAARNWKNSMEDIWFATVSRDYTFNVDAVKLRRRVLAPYRADGAPKGWVEGADGKLRDTHPSNFWDDISVPYWSMPENTDHPAQKPEKLLAKLILASSNPGDIILDPFAGSGTTAVAAKKLARRFVVVEREREYCALAQRRLELAETDGDIQGYAGGIFWERNTLALQQKHGRDHHG
jgi:site-specific DNA-methyltransferase (adenine-specific)